MIIKFEPRSTHTYVWMFSLCIARYTCSTYVHSHTCSQKQSNLIQFLVSHPVYIFIAYLPCTKHT